MQIPFRRTKDGITIQVRVLPRSSRRGIEGCAGESLRVRLTAPPVDGAANDQLIEILSEELGVKKRLISIIKGVASKDKVISIRGVQEL